MARKGTVDQLLEAQRKAGGGISVRSHPEFEDNPTPLERLVSKVKNVGSAVGKALTPKPIGNSQKDRHNARASEFAMTEAERERQLRRLDKNIAADKRKK